MPLLRTPFVALCMGAACLPAVPARTDPPVWTETNFYGVPGLVDMPNARMQPDGEISLSAHAFDTGTIRTVFAFQIFPRVQGVFRYATLPDARGPLSDPDRTYDRSFDVRFQVLREGRLTPALTVGLQDFGGTGIYAGEYVAATKGFGAVEVTGGIGWGRLGSAGSFDNPLGFLGDRFDDRGGFEGEGGEFSADQWFRGPAALFAGAAWRATDRLTFKAEISSDDYVRETLYDLTEIRTPVNLGVDWAATDNLRVSAALRGGDAVGVGLTYAINPRRSAVGTGVYPAPAPVLLRPDRAAAPEIYGTEWTEVPGNEEIVAKALRDNLAEADLYLQFYRVTGDTAQVRFINSTYESQAQAIGRAARALSRSLPASVETFVLIPLSSRFLPATAVILRRSDVERFENLPDGAKRLLASARIVDATTVPTDGLETVEGRFPRLRWSLGPNVSVSTFDPDNPLRFDLSAELSGSYQPRPGLLFSGSLRQKIIGNRDEADRPSTSVLPRVRSESFLFARQEDPFIAHLTAEWFFRPARNLYGRVSAGLLERQFGGVSTELLWQPPTSSLAVGVEVNRVRQRDFDMRFGFQDLDATTAHVTAYYDLGGGYLTSLNVGRYLAGDEGATLSLSRRFANGYVVGAYATKTNVSTEEFGEGSFDKGFFVRVPVAAFTGQNTRRTRSITIQPILRDGGARLRVRNRLYGVVNDRTGDRLTEDWGRVWR